MNPVDGAFSFRGIEHTAIASGDPRALANWYVEHLGFHINFEPPNSSAVFVKSPDGSMIEIIESAGGPLSRPELRDHGFRHVAIAVSDFDAAFAHLESRGVKFLIGKTTVDGNTTAFFRDCDGNLLHLLHREKALP